MFRRGILSVVLIMVCCFVFAQTGSSALRDYVGRISQTYHPGIVSYFEKIKGGTETTLQAL